MASEETRPSSAPSPVGSTPSQVPVSSADAETIPASHAPMSGRGPATLAEDRLAPDRLAGYKILRTLGQGGMGVVYLAKREDSNFAQRVALKVIKRGMDTDDIVRRFEVERKVLSGLNHPGIARLIDGGTTEDGRPYFALEYVEGVPLDKYCDAQRLSTTQRIELFRKVCAAVHYAHQNLIVHRDLKPGNILVTSDGQPKLLDFGIAKLLNPSMFEVAEITGPGLRLMTPEYASPEQVRGDPITTASDVYSLGVMLYELVTGRRPYKFKTRLQHEIQRIICEEEPERPSTMISRLREVEASTPAAPSDAMTSQQIAAVREGDVERLRKKLRGDIDDIVLKALEKSPQRRYSSAEQFAEDLARHLSGQPVTARPASAAYKFQKFVRRNRGPVAAGVALFLVLAAGVATTTAQWQRAEGEREVALAAQAVAQEQRAAAEAARDVADEQRAAAENAKAVAQEQRAAAEAARAIADEQRAQAENAKAVAEAARVEAQTQKERAEAAWNDLWTLSTRFIDQFHAAVTKLPGSLPARELLVNTGAEYMDKLVASAGDDTDKQVTLAAIYERLGQIQADMKGGSKGDVAAALVQQRRALDIRQKALAAKPDDRSLLLATGTSLLRVGDLQTLAGESAEAAKTYEAALTMLRRLDADTKEAVPALQRIAALESKLGDQRLAANDLDGATARYEEADRVRTRVLAIDGTPLARRNQSVGRIDLARVLQRRGELPRALELVESAIQTRQELLAATPEQAREQRDLAVAHYEKAILLLEAGRAAQAREPVLTARRIMGALVERERGLAEGNAGATDARNVFTLAIIDIALGRSLIGAGDADEQSLAEAIEAFDRAAEALEPLADEAKQNAEYTQELGSALAGRAGVLVRQGSPGAALVAMERARGIAETAARREGASPETRVVLADRLAESARTAEAAAGDARETREARARAASQGAAWARQAAEISDAAVAAGLRVGPETDAAVLRELQGRLEALAAELGASR